MLLPTDGLWENGGDQTIHRQMSRGLGWRGTIAQRNIHATEVGGIAEHREHMERVQITRPPWRTSLCVGPLC